MQFANCYGQFLFVLVKFLILVMQKIRLLQSRINFLLIKRDLKAKPWAKFNFQTLNPFEEEPDENLH